MNYRKLKEKITCKRILTLIFKMGVLVLFFVFGLNYYIYSSTKSSIYSDTNKVSKSYTALVLGAKVYRNGNLSVILQDRVNTALDLYQSKKITRFLLSGDHGKSNYDEVNLMKDYLIKKGVPKQDIFLDHAGFDTYDSVYRAKHIFNVTEIVIVTQHFHVKRAVYIAKSLGLKVQGFTADKHQYGIAKKMVLRESLANVKAFLELLFHKKPKYLGSIIDIKGDSSLSYD